MIRQILADTLGCAAIKAQHGEIVMATDAYESQKIQALQAINQTLQRILNELIAIKSAQSQIAQKSR
jgi:hypothetical protein